MNYNIITVSFGALRKITGPSVSYQYDAVQYLVIRGLELPAAYRVDFCNDGDASTISMVATDNCVLIPDQLLATGKNIKAYIVLNGTDEGAVETRYEITLPVNKRPAPSDIAPIPAQQQQIDKLIEQLSDALEKSVPAGGLAGQVLAKATDNDYDLEWVDQSGGGEGGTTNYNRLTHKPQINGIELEGDKSAADLGLATPSDIPTVPVQSVAGKTGAVDLNAGDIEFDDTETYAAGSIGAEVSAQKNAISQKAPVIINTASGDVAMFDDGADGGKIKKIVGMIVTPEGGSGWTGANIEQRGKNLCPTRNCSEITTTWTQNGSNFVKEIKGLDPSKYYTFSLTVLTALGTAGEHRLYVNGNSYGFIDTGSEVGRLSRTIKPAENGIITLTQNATAARDTAYQNALIDFQLEADSVSTAFEAYKSQTLPINWQAEAGTILNGTVTLNEDRSADVVNSGTGDSYHLTGVGNLSTYYGVNNVWIDTGAITECDYPADTKLYIDGLTAPDEDMIADGLIASGKYFTVNNQLYLSTAQIAAGAQIIPGSNCTATSITEALNALNT